MYWEPPSVRVDLVAEEYEIYYPAPAVVPSSRAATVEPEPFVHKIMYLRPLRAMQRYGAARGAMLSGGIAYSALFSIFAALTIAWTVFMAVLGKNEALRQTVIDGINDAMPGILKTADNPSGLIAPESLVMDTALNPASIIAIVVLLFTALSVMNALKVSIRAMFGISKLPENFLILKIRDLVGFIGLGAGVVLSSLLTTAAGVLGSKILSAIGIEGTLAQIAVRVGSLFLAFLVDLIVIAILFRYLAGARPMKKDLLLGAGLGALGTSVVRFLGTSVIGSVADNPILAPFAALATLLLWVNFVARIVLIAAAFTANPEPPYKVEVPETIHAEETPNFVTLSAPETTRWHHEPFTGVIVPLPDRDPSLTVQPSDRLPHWDTLEGKRRLRKIERMTEKLTAARVNYRIDYEREKDRLSRG